MKWFLQYSVLLIKMVDKSGQVKVDVFIDEKTPKQDNTNMQP